MKRKAKIFESMKDFWKKWSPFRCPDCSYETIRSVNNRLLSMETIRARFNRFP